MAGIEEGFKSVIEEVGEEIRLDFTQAFRRAQPHRNNILREESAFLKSIKV